MIGLGRAAEIWDGVHSIGFHRRPLASVLFTMKTQMPTVLEILYPENKAGKVRYLIEQDGVDQNTALHRINMGILENAIQYSEDVDDLKEVLTFMLENSNCLRS